MKRHSFRLAAAALGLLLVLPTGLPASAASSFDAGYYATHYPDVAAACGTDEGALLQHYIQFGASEGRKPSAWGRAGDTDLKLTDTQIAAIWSPVPIKELANYKSLKRKMTDDEFAQAYEQARRIVTPLAFKSREEQLAGIANALREMVDDGTVCLLYRCASLQRRLWVSGAACGLLCRMRPHHRPVSEHAGHPL